MQRPRSTDYSFSCLCYLRSTSMNLQSSPGALSPSFQYVGLVKIEKAQHFMIISFLENLPSKAPVPSVTLSLFQTRFHPLYFNSLYSPSNLETYQLKIRSRDFLSSLVLEATHLVHPFPGVGTTALNHAPQASDVQRLIPCFKLLFFLCLLFVLPWALEVQYLILDLLSQDLLIRFYSAYFSTPTPSTPSGSQPKEIIGFPKVMQTYRQQINY